MARTTNISATLSHVTGSTTLTVIDPIPRILVRRGTGVTTTWDDISEPAAQVDYLIGSAPVIPSSTGIYVGFVTPFQGIRAQADHNARWDDDAEGTTPPWFFTSPGLEEQFTRCDTGTDLTWLRADNIFSRVYYPTNAHDPIIASCTTATIAAGNALDNYYGNPIGESYWTYPVPGWGPGLAGAGTLDNWPSLPTDASLYWVLINHQECALTFTRGALYNSERLIKLTSIGVILPP